MAISATRTKWESVDALKEFAGKEGVEIEWVPKSYEYNLSQSTQKMCNKETAEVLLRMIYIRIGYKSVIAPMWSMATDNIQLWLPVFMERMAAGNYVIDATYEAKMEVKKKLYMPEVWACIHLFGNPYVRGGIKIVEGV